MERIMSNKRHIATFIASPADLAAERKRDVLDAARLYSTFNDALGLYWLHSQAEDLEVEGRWQAKARSNLRDEFYRLRRKHAFQFGTKWK